MVPAICTFLGAIFSCTNYFRVIFTGGVGKNGSTIAVSQGNLRFISCWHLVIFVRAVGLNKVNQ